MSVIPEEQRDKKGKPLPTIENILLVMENSVAYEGIKFNELLGRAEIHTVKNKRITISPWTDADEAQSMYYIEKNFNIFSKEKHSAALKILFDERKYNPLTDIVDKVKWDGKERCQHLLSTWMKTDDTPYTREVSRLIFAGGIHRLYEPGCKFEDVPILIGTQGCGKSTVIRFLAINDDYFGELKVMEGVQAIEDLSGKWIMEIPELAAFTKAKDQEQIKAFASRQRDHYRKPYDKHPTELYRRCIFLASTNDHSPLIDKTGNRRWYPVECKGDRKWGYEVFDREDEIRDYCLQAWAEAREKLNSKEMQPYANKELLPVYQQAQENALQDDWRTGAITAYLEKKLPGEYCCVRELFHRALSPNPDFPKEPSLVESKDVGKILNGLPDWERVSGARKVGAYGNQRCWRKIEPTRREEIPPPWEDDE